MLKLTALSFVVISLALLTGCGGGGGGGNSTPAVPAPPLSLTVESRTTAVPSPVVLSWTAPNDSSIRQYGIYRKLLGQTAYTRIATVPATQTVYSDSLATTDRYKDAYYQVVSINANGVESDPVGPVLSESPVPPPGT